MTEGKTKTAGGSIRAAPPGPVRLRVVEGPDEGLEVRLSQGTALVGSGADCELRLSDPTVSRRHAQLALLGARLLVTDLGSKNGLKYLGARLKSAEVPLGATLALGKTTLALLPARDWGDAELDPPGTLEGLTGRSVAMRRLFFELRKVASTEAPVLIRGETGVGKETVAKALHRLSPRAQGPLRVFDCAAAQPELLHSQLFGHVQGAFTGAHQASPGALVDADGGTLFLDEVAELPLSAQPIFLRALDSQDFLPVGGAQPRRSDFRLIAATHADLEALVAQRKFHRGLYYRLAGFVLTVPPLRERLEDLPELVRALAGELQRPELTALPQEALAALSGYAWPGNVRELRNMVSRGALGPGSARPSGPPRPFKGARAAVLQAFERAYLEDLLAREPSVAAAARAAGVTKSYFYELLNAHGLRKGDKD